MQTTSNTTHDAFAKYSDDAVRLKTLTLSTGDDFNLHDFANRHYATQRVNLSEDRPIPRKTRISFELHPSLVLLDGLMKEVWNDDSTTAVSLQDEDEDVIMNDDSTTAGSLQDEGDDEDEDDIMDIISLLEIRDGLIQIAATMIRLEL